MDSNYLVILNTKNSKLLLEDNVGWA